MFNTLLLSIIKNNLIILILYLYDIYVSLVIYKIIFGLYTIMFTPST